MALLSVQQVRMSFGGPPLLDSVSLHIEPGERVCLLGRNGAGKSSLMRCIAGELVPDSGRIVRQQDLRVSFLPQEVPQGLGGTVFELAARGLGKLGHSLAAYQQLSAELAHRHGNRQLLARLDRLQHSLDMDGGWLVHRQVEQILSHLDLDPNAPFASLSGGLKRRTLLAAALVSDPDLLLLDEPTNHLDITAIDWLEAFLLQREKALLFVTHDRLLLRKLATRIVELDRGRLSSWSCDYDAFLKRKRAALDAEAQEWAQLDKKIAQEEIWIHQGITARRTRNEGRMRALQALRAARRSRRQQPGSVRLQAQDAQRSGKRVIRATDLSYSYTDQPLIDHFSTTIMRGDKVGIIGPNGSGKTTLLQLLLGLLPPQRGIVEHGTRLRIAYFDQLRIQLDETKTVQDMVGDGHDTVTLNGKPRHIFSYLQDFLFPPERARSPVKALSGGERNRLLLARLFLQPSNVLVLDEPTNDLDLDTLELLEELLLDYPGTVLLVSHDRALLNNVVTSVVAFEGEGRVHEYVGGYDDWLRQRRPAPTQTPTPQPKPDTARPPRATRKKLSYKQQQELHALPEKIEQLEAEQNDLHRQLADPKLYRHNGGQVGPLKARLSAVEHELEAAFARWETLEAVQQG